MIEYKCLNVKIEERDGSTSMPQVPHIRLLGCEFELLDSIRWTIIPVASSSVLGTYTRFNIDLVVK